MGAKQGNPPINAYAYLVVDRMSSLPLIRRFLRLRALFPPPPTADLRNIDRYAYNRALEASPITTTEISHAISKTTSFNAPDVDTVPNAALKQAIQMPEVLQILTDLFNACLRIGYCPRHFG